MTQATFALQGHNPDVLTCIANLSNDEVFTPPELANQMLDSLADAWAASNSGANIWENAEVTFLDPCTKSGVFLREIVKRLNEGLTRKIPDLTERIDHILTKQVFGIGITQLTTLLARRSVYCSKYANGIHSVARTFTSDSGNIWFQRTEHTWISGKCKFCGVNKSGYARGGDLETHAYAFLHGLSVTDEVQRMFGDQVRFDVVIGNPPYQLSTDGAGAQARPIYPMFVEQAKMLEPRFVVMVTPSRWFSGGMGLDSFRSTMLGDRRLREIVDFLLDRDAFPNVNINGGVNYFLWDREYSGNCRVTTIEPGKKIGDPVIRPLDEFDIFIRRNEAVSILRKVLKAGYGSFSERVSAIDPFKLPTTYHGADTKSAKRPVKLYGSGKESFIASSEVNANSELIEKWKVLIPQATDGNENYPLPIWNQVGPIVSGPGEACTFTYLIASVARSKREAESIASLMRTKFFRFMVFLRKGTQHNKSETFKFVPDLPLDTKWTDEDLYAHFGLSKREAAYIESMIRSMEFTGE
jgi:site-specific DNA-methyltransferase (adenine-specific)